MAMPNLHCLDVTVTIYNNLLTFIYCMYIVVCLLTHALGTCA